jgi:SAM-dependent methyltransferase
VQNHTYALSEDLSSADIETIYRDVVLKQDFYGDTYGREWSIGPFQDMTRILTQTMKPKRHLDIGCGEGLMVLAMREAGVDSRGIDFSEALINRAQPSIRDHVQVASVENWLERSALGEVDLVSYMEVFEHLPISVVKEILTAIRGQLKGNLFLTIPSYGIDHTFRGGIVVNSDNPQWTRDMQANVPMRNIVLEDGTPHLGHITLASYRWWSEFFMSMGFGRHYDIEGAMQSGFAADIARYRWNPYVITPMIRGDANLLQQPQHLVRGWHALEPDSNGRWTDGYAQAIIHGSAPAAVEVVVTLPSANVIQHIGVWVTVEKLIVNDNLQFSWIPVGTKLESANLPRERRVSVRLQPGTASGNEEYAAHGEGCWRVTVVTPPWSPKAYGLSDDARQLGVFVHSLKVVE